MFHVLLVMVLEIIIVYHAILDSSYYTEHVLIIALLDIGNLGMDIAMLAMNHVTLVMELGQQIVWIVLLDISSIIINVLQHALQEHILEVTINAIFATQIVLLAMDQIQTNVLHVQTLKKFYQMELALILAQMDNI